MNFIFQLITFTAWAIYFYLLYVFFGMSLVTEYTQRWMLNEFAISLISTIVCIFTLFNIFSFIEFWLKRIIKKITQKTENTFDDILWVIVIKSIRLLKYVLSISIALQFLILPERFSYGVDQVISVSFLAVILLFITQLINVAFNQKLIDESKMQSVSRALLPFVRKTVVALVWVVGIITVIGNLWYDVTALIAGAWVWGIAIALAAQKSIANIFWAITILMNKPFTLGDYVTINAHTGTVKDIWLSYITLVGRDGHNILIPNENIISTSIENLTTRKYRRADFSIWLVYHTSLTQMEKWIKIIEEILQDYVEEKKLQKFRVNFEAFGDFSLNIFVTYFSNTDNYDEFVKEKEQINLEIKKRFQKAKLEMAFPTTEMIIKWGDIK